MIEAWIISFVLILIRVATFWMFVPIWSSLKPPRMVKLGLIVSLSIFWFTQLHQPVPSAAIWAGGSVHWVFLIVLVARELFLGGVLAMAFYAFIVPMQIAGAYIGQELGLSMATLTDTSTGAINNIVGTILQSLAIVAFFVLDLHYFLIYSLHASFELLPAGDSTNFDSVPLLLFGFAEITSQGIAICSQIALVTFVSLIALLALTRAAPALNLFAVGIPVRLFIGLLAMLIFLPTLLANFESQFDIGLQFLKSILKSIS